MLQKFTTIKYEYDDFKISHIHRYGPKKKGCTEENF